MITAFDHIIVLTNDIEQTEQAFTETGFTVSHREDEGPSPADHRLVCFKDGSYLELFSFKPGEESAKNHRWFSYSQISEGFCDYGVTSDNITGIVKDAAAAGIAHSPVMQGGKTRIDGVPWELRMSGFGLGVTTPEMPFVLEDVTDHNVRVNGSTQHANGAQRIQSVTIVTDNVAGAQRALSLLTGTQDPEVTRGEQGTLHTYSFEGREIRLLTPDEGTDASARLQQAGPVVYEIEILTDGDSKGMLDPQSHNQARLVLV